MNRPLPEDEPQEPLAGAGSEDRILVVAAKLHRRDDHRHGCALSFGERLHVRRQGTEPG